MKKIINAISITKTIAARITSNMSTVLLAILGVVVAATFLYGVLLLREPLERADFALKVFSGVLAIFVVGVGLAALFTGHVLNDELTKRVGEQRERAIKAEAELADVRERQLPRIFSFNFPKFSEALKGKLKGSAILLYQKDDPEAYMFANQLYAFLQEAGWQASLPKPLPTPSGPGLEDLPSVLNAGTFGFSNAPSSGVAVVARSITPFPDDTSPFGVLYMALMQGGGGAGASTDGSLPQGVLRVIVGPKP